MNNDMKYSLIDAVIFLEVKKYKATISAERDRPIWAQILLPGKQVGSTSQTGWLSDPNPFQLP